MSINLALNTIIYIMVFLFPGLVFRRAFFIGKFHTRFDLGGALEKILWSILFSGVSMCLFFLFVKFINSLSPTPIIDAISFEYLSQNLIDLYDNKHPRLLEDQYQVKRSIISFGYLLAFSAFLGVLLNKIVCTLGLDHSLSFLKFQNYWNQITESNNNINLLHKIGSTYYTHVTIKSSDGKTYSGKLQDLYYDKDNKLETVCMLESYQHFELDKITDAAKIININRKIKQQPSRYIYLYDTSNHYVYKRALEGDVFTISSNKVETTSIKFLQIKGFGQRLSIVLKKIISIFIVLATIFCLSYIIWDYGIINFSSYAKRVFFCLITPFNLFILLTAIVMLTQKLPFRERFKERVNGVITILFLICFCISYLYIFDYIDTASYAIGQISSVIILAWTITVLQNFRKKIQERLDVETGSE